MKATLAFFLILATAISVEAITIDMVTVGNAGNAPDTSYAPRLWGSVGYVYQIGKYEVTAEQYTAFLNGVAKSDPNGLYSTWMGDPGNPTWGANIKRSGSSPNFSYSVASDWANRPVNFVSFWDAARFANWLHNGQPTGAQGPGTTEGGAYHDIGNDSLFGRNPDAKFFIPTRDEWYKAAYHDKSAGLAGSYFDYPTGTNAVPGTDISETTNPGNNANYGVVYGAPYHRTVVGEFELSASPYGTFDQGGNIWEWNETAVNTIRRVNRGGAFAGPSTSLYSGSDDINDPSSEHAWFGFRVAGIPEPSALLLAISAATAVAFCRRR